MSLFLAILPLGLLALLSRRPLAQPQVVLDLLQIFDAPVSAELENSRNLSALRRRVSLEQTLARISARIVGAEHERLDEVIVEALGELAGHARADRAYVFAVAEDDAHACNTHEWCAPGVSTQIGSLQQYVAAEEGIEIGTVTSALNRMSAAMAKRGEEPYRTLCLRSGRPADGVLSNGQLFKGLLKDLRDKTEQYL